MSGYAPQWVVGEIGLDEIGPVLAEYPENYRWNGWLQPLLDTWSCEKILEPIAECYDWEWVEALGTWLLVVRQKDDPAYVDVVTPNEDGLYPLGAGSWVWSKWWPAVDD